MFPKAVPNFDILGFRVRLNPTWLLIAALIVWSLSSSYFPQRVEGLGPLDSVVLSIGALIGLFACLLMHELAHSLAARRLGLGTGSITLFIFGGVAELDERPESVRSEILIAVAGPVMSFALAAFFWFGHSVAENAGPSTALHALLGYLVFINLVLGLVNLLPAFPLDGGRVLRALLWRRHGDIAQATRSSARVAAAVAYALVLLGLFSLFAFDPVSALWQILFGLFLLVAAQSTYHSLLIGRALGRKPVSAFMTVPAVSVDAAETLAGLAESVMLRHALSFVPVTDGPELLGYIDTALLKTIDRENWADTHVGDVYAASDTANTVMPEMGADELMELIFHSGRRKYLVAQGSRLAGVVTLTDLLGYLALYRDIGRSAGSAGHAHAHAGKGGH